MRIRGFLGAVRRRLTEFGAGTAGAVTVEFVIAVPLLLGVLAFAVQYGYAMQVRNALDVAVRDAARYMSRAPVDPSTNSIDAAFLTKASQLVHDRIASSASVTVNDMEITGSIAAIKATARVELPLLQVLGWFSGDAQVSSIDMVSCEGWTVSESRNASGTLAQQLSSQPFANCPDGSLAAVMP